jgi:predicted Fe-Mo cluster-binding NifX family protein
MTPAPILKIAVTSEGPTLADPVDPRFGRAGGFVVVDLETMTTAYVDNGSSQVLAQGAGIQAAENLVKAGAQALLTGHVGPKAWTALEASGVKVVQGVENMTVGEAITRFKAGRFAFSDAPSH